MRPLAKRGACPYEKRMESGDGEHPPYSFYPAPGEGFDNTSFDTNATFGDILRIVCLDRAFGRSGVSDFVR